jgi:hypothetical protein
MTDSAEYVDFPEGILLHDVATEYLLMSLLNFD